MTLSQFQRKLDYASNLIDSPAIRASNKAPAQILAPKRTSAARRRKHLKH